MGPKNTTRGVNVQCPCQRAPVDRREWVTPPSLGNTLACQILNHGRGEIRKSTGGVIPWSNAQASCQCNDSWLPFLQQEVPLWNKRRKEVCSFTPHSLLLTSLTMLFASSKKLPDKHYCQASIIICLQWKVARKKLFLDKHYYMPSVKHCWLDKGTTRSILLIHPKYDDFLNLDDVSNLNLVVFSEEFLTY